MVFARHPEIALSFAEQLEGLPDTPFLSAAASSAKVLSGTMGFDPPSWQALCEGVRPETLEPDEFEPGILSGGHQHETSGRKFSSHAWRHGIEPQFGLRVVLEAAWQSPFRPPSHISGWCCCFASASHFLSHRMRAGVAVQSIRLATTVHAPEQGHLGGGGLHSRVLRVSWT